MPKALPVPSMFRYSVGMPKSRGRRKKPGRDIKKKQSSGPVFRTMRPPADYDQFRAAITDGARKIVERLPETFASFQQLAREHDPAGLLASIAYYGLQRGMREDGSTHAIGGGLEQHHVELLQAVLLTVPADEWSSAPSMPHAIQQLFDTLPDLPTAFLAQRIVAGRQIDDLQARTVAAIQEKVRLHTSAVRNWGYFGDVIAIAREIYSPLDKTFVAHHGFAASDVIEIGQTMVTELERRANEWTGRMRRALAPKTSSQMLSAYYENFPELAGNAESLATIIPEGTPREAVLAMLLSHADLRHEDTATFDAATLSGLTSIDESRVQKALEAISLEPGALAGQELNQLFLANPVWLAPLIKLGGEFLAPMPQAIMSHIHAILRHLAERAGALVELDGARKNYLEARLAQTLATALPNSTVIPGATWSMSGQRFETDVIVLIDKVMIIAEAKAHHLTAPGLRGAPDRVRRHVRDMVVDPSLQSARLEAVLRQAQAGDSGAAKALGDAGISDPANIDHVIRLSVSLDDLSVLSSAERDLREAGWVPDDHELAPMMNIADLAVVADILDQPVTFLHYLSERGPAQRAWDLLGDELDLLGLYLDTGFNMGGLPEDVSFAVPGMSDLIDRYYDARDAGRTIPKPKPKLTKYIRLIIDHLAERRPPGWTIIGMHLLGVADPDEQVRLGRMLDKARKAVRRGIKAVQGGAVVAVTPKLERKITIAFYVHDQTERAAIRQSMEQVAGSLLGDTKKATCVVFGRHIDRWDEPYEVVCLAQQAPSNCDADLV